VVETAAQATASVRRRITEDLLGFLEAERPHLEVEAQPLVDELEAVISAGGKRLRPTFCYWGHRAAGGKDAPGILRVAAALELLHTFALLLDDVMDRSPTRRSRSSSFRALAGMAGGTGRGDPARFGVSAAILTGLLAFVLADRMLLGAGVPAAATSRAADRYDRMRTRAIGGQYLDLLAAHRGEADESTARRIGVLKSAGYTVADPLAIGALLATEDGSVIAALEAYGYPLGEAFQIRDDVLGVFGDPDRTGKDRDGDLREGKQTVLLAKARALATPADRALLEDAVGDRGLDSAGAERARKIIASCGALDETEALIAELAAQARAALDRTVLDARAAEELERLTDEVTVRDL
jgi:geranylgeranyl diphosphate synthase type I